MSDTDRHVRMTELFTGAIALPEAQRSAWLEARTRDDASLREKIEALIARDGERTSFDTTTDGNGIRDAGEKLMEVLVSAVEEELAVPTKIGEFTVIRRLGPGGMADVFLAKQVDPPREVAVKILSKLHLDPSGLERFSSERRALARLNHQGIPKIYASGWDGAQPLFAMTHVEGENIADYVSRVRLGVRGTLELLAKVCDAVAHAHAKLVVHCDLKPDHILVAAGEPTILDFGIAKVTDSEDLVTRPTQVHKGIGTRGYMSPEQSAEDPNEVGTGADIFALGVLANELLTGRSPSDGQKARSRRRSGDPKRVPREVKLIIAMAMQHDLSRRYQSVWALKEDIRRFLHHEPILAHPRTTLYRGRKFFRRHPKLMAMATTVVLAIVTCGFYWRQAAQARAFAEFEAYVGNLGAADVAIERNEPRRVQDRLKACPERLWDRWEWRWLKARSDNSIECVPLAVQVSRNPALCSLGNRILAASGGGFARVCETASGRKLAGLDRDGNYVPVGVLTPSGDLLALVEGFQVRIVNTATGQELLVKSGHAAEVGFVGFSPGGERLITASADCTARIWESQTGRLVATLRNGHSKLITSAAFSPAGDRVITTSHDRTAIVWEIASEAVLRVLTKHSDYVLAAAFSPSGDRIVTGSLDHTACLWNARTFELLGTMTEHGLEVVSVAFSPDGERIVTASYDRTARIWDAHPLHEQCAQLAVLRGHLHGLSTAVFTPKGDRVMAVSRDGVVREWDALSTSEPPVLPAQANKGMEHAAFDHLGDRIVTASGKSACIWNAHTGKPVRSLIGHDDTVLHAEFDQGQDRVVTASMDGTARVWNATTGDQLAVLDHSGAYVYSAAFNDTGDRVVTACKDGVVRIWDVGARQVAKTLDDLGAPVRSAAFSKDGLYIVGVFNEKTVRVWDTGTWTSQDLCGHTGRINSVSFSPSSKQIVSAAIDGTVRLWDRAESREVGRLVGHEGNVWSAAYSHDGTRVVTAGGDHTARVWDVARAKELTALRGHGGDVVSASFSTDGDRIVTASWDGSSRVWDAVAYGRRFAEQNDLGAGSATAPRSQPKP